MREFSTPMMQQYMNIKQQYPDCLLFFRLGDFYELFLDDAIVGAKALEIVLTRRPRGKDGDIPMAGVPFHAADGYIAKLVKMGHKVAICEQVSDPSLKGIVERDVVRIVTPGTILDEKTLRAKEHNYTMSISRNESIIAFAVADVSTGDFQVTEIPYSENFTHILHNELARFMPSECVLNSELYNDAELLGILTATKNSNVYHFPEWDTHAEQAEAKLKKHFSIKTLRSFGLHDKPMAVRVAGALLGYLAHTQKDNIGHINTLKTYSPDEHVILDASTISNLELFSTIRDNEEVGSFVHCIDETKTAMGGRLLRRWIREPLRNKKLIESRLNAVECVLHERSLREKVRIELARMYDIERIISRLSVGIGTPHDLVNLKVTLQSAAQIHAIAKELTSSLLQERLATIPEILPVAQYIEDRLVLQ
jgi:DNA mismatch repair protein MutS